MALEDVEKKLYGLEKEEAKKPQASKPGIETEGVKTEWEERLTEEKEAIPGRGVINKVGRYSKILFWLILVAILAGGGFVYYYVSQYQKSKELNFEILSPNKVMIAKPFELSVNIENKSQSVLRQPKMVINLPEGAVSLDKFSDAGVIEQTLDDMAPAGLVKKKFNLVFVKDEQAIKKFNVNFSYLPEKLNTRFEKSQSVEIAVDQPAISINLITPQKVFNREIFDINVNYQNLNDYEYKNSRLQIVYPANFTFKQASVSPSLGNSVWQLTQLAKGIQNNINIKGSLEGPDQSFSQIKSRLFVVFGQKEYMINEKSANLAIAASPLSLSILANDNPNYFASAADQINYLIKYKNNTDVGLSDVILKINLQGAMYDFSTLSTTGFFDSRSNAIIWNAGNTPEFKLLQPGAEGEIRFVINVLNSFPIKRMFDKNFTLKVQAEINSPTVPYNVSSDRTVGYANLETKVKGALEIIPSFVYLSGRYPLIAEKNTVFEIYWRLKNYSTDVKDVKISSVLQSGVRWLNIVKSNVDTVPAYNERTGEVEWNITKIIATRGVISKPAEAIFRVEVTPNVAQIGMKFPFLSETSVSAIDEFTNSPINLKTDVLATEENVSF
ncbi:hypothetical protein HZB05_00655 [Candidatus Wolfebacteria bacterium]|nr:hypothetical protein [Candidatus Wolfebacteria bacterium]